jgi:Tol biopolymer transport system component
MFIQTEHFDIYYDLGSKYLAEFAASVAEKSLLTISNDLNYTINRRIPIILYNSHVQFQQTNAISSYMPEGVGGVTELLKNRVVLPFDGNYESFRHVIAHELTHAIMNDMFYGGTFQTAMSSGSIFEIPIWMAEGLAEWESLKTLTTHTDMFIRDLVISNLLPDLNRLDGYLAYRGGQIFYWYIADNYGEGKIGELINKLNGYRNVETAFKSTFNMTLEEFSEKWTKDLKKMYLPDVKTFEDPSDFAENLTNHKKSFKYWNTSPSISPNGQKFAFISDDDGVYAIYVKDLNDKKSEPEKLVSSFRQQDFEELNLLTPGISWNPTGDKLAISAKAGGENAVFIVDVKSGNYEKLTWGLHSITSVTWSPDGKKLAFTATLPLQSDIFIYDFKSKKLDNLTNDIFSDGTPEWASDSKSIYFISDRLNNLSTGETGIAYKIWRTDYDAQDIYNIELEKNQIKRLTFEPKFRKTSLASSVIQNKLLFVSDKNGIENIYELDLTTLKTSPKTNSILGISQISLSPDGSKLLFSGQNNGGYDIFFMRFPFEKRIEKNELPQTVYRETTNEKRNLISELSELSNVNKEDSTQTQTPNYGKFKIDFSRQNFIEPNPDVVKKQVSERSVKGEQAVEDEEFLEKPYKITFSPDAIMGNPSYNNYYGFQSLTQMLFSDIMGDHQIYAQGYLLTDLRNSAFLVNYAYMPQLIDYGATLYHNSLLTYLDDGWIYRFRNFGLSLDASLPFDLFRRLDFNLSYMYLSKDNVQFPQIPSVERNLLVPSVRYIFDNTLGGWFGPSRGIRYFISALASPKVFSNSASFYNFETDFRFYQPIISNYMTFAIRGAAGGSFGANTQKYFMGGTENWFGARFFNNRIPLNDPTDYGFLQFKMPMRGWEIGQKSGSKFFMINSELRFPLFTALLAGPIPILLQGVQGSLFFDMGGAFNEKFVAAKKDIWGVKQPEDMMMSTGIGVRSYLLGLPFKLDIAWKNLYHNWSKPQWIFSLGYDF